MKKLFLLLFLLANCYLIWAQEKTIQGTVTDASNNVTLPGVTVIVVGTTNGAVTDIDGKYILTVPGNAAELQFSFIGMQTQIVSISGRSVIDVTLSPETQLIDELVVVGYGTQQKETVVGSIAQTKGEELLKAGSVPTVSEALSGILPGVSTMQASGQPGATEATILIRGQSSWNNNSPLFLVDGVERPFNDLDPNEIESISVLKDASATAVFGVKAANGVILITTKRGLVGKTRVSFTGNWGVKVPVMETDYMLDYASALEYYNIAALNEGKYGALIPQSDIDAWRDPNRDMDFYSYTSWINELVKTGPTQSYNINVSGGNEFVKYFTSVGYNLDGDIFRLEEQQDFDPRTSQKRYNWRSNLDFSFTKTTTLKVNLSGDFKDWNGNYVTANSLSGIHEGGVAEFLGGLFSQVQVGTPPILSDGRLGVGNYGTDWFTQNYLGEMEREGQYSRRTTRVYSDFIFEQVFLRDFKFKGKLSYNFDRQYQANIETRPLYYRSDYRTGTITQFGINPDQVEMLPRYNPETLDLYSNSLYYELSLDYNKTINEDHNVSGLFLFSRRRAQWASNFPSYEESWVGRATYNYKFRYMFEFNGAYNGSEKFAPGLRFGFFPSVALGWTVSEENFFKENIGFIDFMKFRYSWGEIGSDIGARRFTYISDYKFRNEGSEGLFGYGVPYDEPDVIYFEGEPANLNATWETAVKQNIGLEMTFLSNRLKTNFDLFDEKRTGILMRRKAIPSWYGNTAPDANIGETKNHGFEAELIWNSTIGNDITYFVKANVSLSENRIVNQDDPLYLPDYRKDAGKPIGWNRGYLMDGYLNSWNDVYNTAQPVAATRIPGDFTYVDYNADGVIDDKDVVPILSPSYAAKTFAFSLGFTWRQFSINALLNGTVGLSKPLSNSFLWEFGTTGGINYRMLNTEMLNYWTPENQNPGHPALHTVSNAYNTWSNSYTRRDADFMRLKSVELKYTFDKVRLERTKLFEGLEIYVNGNNLVTWSKLPDLFDPEAAKLEVYPLSKRFSMGVRASF